MLTTNKFVLFDPSEIVVERDKRQRRELTNIDDMADSINRIGLLHPIIITKDKILKAGERRLMGFRLGCKFRDENVPGWEKFPKKIPVHFLEELSHAEARLIELEENLKRVDITWEESALAVLELHEAKQELSPGWTLAKTGEAVGLTEGTVSMQLSVGRALRSKDTRVCSAQGVRQAFNIIQRQQSRVVDTELSQMDELFSEDKAELPPATAEEISVANFNEWAAAYSGRKFNFLHCDFPYGVNMQDSDQGNSDTWGAYEDTPEIYWQLCRTLADNLDKLLFRSAHVMFWFSMNFYTETVNFFSTYTDLAVQPFPLVWHKTDNRGILPDVERQPRRVYETALIMSRGDRRLVQAVSNAYGAPTQKEHHLSEKSEAVLRNFFRMFVDKQTEMLDPTCGAGSALRAAEALGASRICGLDIAQENVDISRGLLIQQRNKARLSDAAGA